MKFLALLASVFMIVGLCLFYFTLNPPKPVGTIHFSVSVLTSEEQHQQMEEQLRSGNFGPLPGAETGTVASTKVVDPHAKLKLGLGAACLAIGQILGFFVISYWRRDRRRRQSAPRPPVNTNTPESRERILRNFKNGVAARLDLELGSGEACQQAIDYIRSQAYSVENAEHFLREVERNKDQLKLYGSRPNIIEALARADVTDALRHAERQHHRDELRDTAKNLGISIEEELRTGRIGDATAAIKRAEQEADKAKRHAERHTKTAALRAKICQVDAQFHDELKRLHALAVQASGEPGRAFVHACYDFEQYFDRAAGATKLKPTRRAS